MNKFTDIINKIGKDISKDLSKIYDHFSLSGKILFFVIIILCLIIFFKSLNGGKNNQTILFFKEGFVEKPDEFTFKQGPEVYDDFYSSIYDYLVFSNVKNDYEIGQIINKTSPTHESIILDIGSATGHHVASLAKRGLKATGLDNSAAMIKQAKENYPKYDFVLGDAMNADEFQANSFTHILCLYFTIYYMKDKDRFFQNCFNWLMPGGYLVIHLVDREMFDPIIPPANPLMLLTPQRYAKKRITTSAVTFDDFKYDSNFELNQSNNEAVFIEKFKNKNTGKVFRKQEHKMYMELEEDILRMAQDKGFIVQGKIDLIKSGYEYNSLYILTKPN